ncbi:EAL and HDOD domain-containing protein [Noviherbaspirillum galbum]|uniref:EAL domain-containing protein n=1 Tax=Noviherbaspirillum galbum TaxID=2709383 RepID=A0A6B3SFQ3_9BURK|nr:EAL domain-containing protein [Noviherbaspirillum galbum]NEX59727.1 EAL domain-containing protein [Noviherbaspirillum galbum]
MSHSMQEAVMQSPRAKDFFLARQPILNRDQGLVAYELLFRRADTSTAGVIDDLSATAAVISHAAELGIENVIGDSLGFVNIDSTVLMSDFVGILPAKYVVLEILETVEVTDAVVARVAELKDAGYSFALDDVIGETAGMERLLPYVDIIKVDLMGMSDSELISLSKRFRAFNKKLLAEKVETVEQFNLCLELGFEFFQGYYFAKPVVLTGKKLSPSQLALLRVMGMINSDSENVDIERAIKQDAALGLNLLKMVNSPAFCSTQRIGTVGQALILMGRRQLQRWLQILLYTDAYTKPGVKSPLLVLATTRGKLLELLAQKLKQGSRGISEVAFTVGIMSLMDTLFGMPMPKILEQMPVNENVACALLDRSGWLGELLNFAEQLERADSGMLALLSELEAFALSIDDLREIQMQAFEWSDQVVRET